MSFIGTFFLAVIVVGSTELLLLVKAAAHIGFLTTLVLCVLTGIVGGSLVRHQGLQTLQGIQGSMARGQVPAVEIVSGLVLLMVGLMLILPGFFTDALGFALLIPPLRRAVASALVKHFRHRVRLHGFGAPGPFDAAGPFGDASPFDDRAPSGDPRSPHDRPGERPRARIIDVDAEARPPRNDQD